MTKTVICPVSGLELEVTYTDVDGMRGDHFSPDDPATREITEVEVIHEDGNFSVLDICDIDYIKSELN